MISKPRVILVSCILASSLAWAGKQAPAQDLPKNPNDLVRAAIKNELKPRPDDQQFTYRLIKKLPNRVETREMVETSAGTVGRLLLVNGKPLTPEQRSKEDARLQRLVADPSQMAQKRKQQEDDDRRTREMVQAMPDAFIYEYAGTEDKEPWGEVAVLKFKPNPKFDPPNQETKVYRGMAGEMWIDLSDTRLALIHAKLFREVAFGWGILGHLDPGGEFMVEQKPVNNGDWEPTHMVLNFTGKILLFKTLKIRQDETTGDYRPVANMSVAHALEFLKKRELEVAQNAAHGSK